MKKKLPIIILIVIVALLLPANIRLLRNKSLYRPGLNPELDQWMEMSKYTYLCGADPWYIFVGPEGGYNQMVAMGVQKDQQSTFGIIRTEDYLSLEYKADSYTIKDLYFRFKTSDGNVSSFSYMLENTYIVDLDGNHLPDVKILLADKEQKRTYYIQFNGKWIECSSLSMDDNSAIGEQGTEYIWNPNTGSWEVTNTL